MHWSNLHHVPSLFALQNAIAAPSRHAGHVQQLRPVDHVVIWMVSFIQFYPEARRLTISPRNTNTVGFNLEAHAAFVLPQCSRHSRFHARRSNLTGHVRRLRLVVGSLRSRRIANIMSCVSAGAGHSWDCQLHRFMTGSTHLVKMAARR